MHDGKLYHLGINGRKNNNVNQPIVEQVCIPNQLRPIMLAIMHCGYEKMYLTKSILEQHVHDVRHYVAQCETCHVAKANRHPVKA